MPQLTAFCYSAITVSQNILLTNSYLFSCIYIAFTFPTFWGYSWPIWYKLIILRVYFCMKELMFLWSFCYFQMLLHAWIVFDGYCLYLEQSSSAEEERSVFISDFQISQESVKVLSCKFFSHDFLLSSPFATSVVSSCKLTGPVLFFRLSCVLLLFFFFKHILNWYWFYLMTCLRFYDMYVGCSQSNAPISMETTTKNTITLLPLMSWASIANRRHNFQSRPYV